MKHVRTLALILVSALLPALARAENWPQWRGPALNGSTTETNLPDRLDTAKNMLWSATLPGHGAGTPIVWLDRVFVSAQEKGTNKLLALCYSRADGQLLWKKEMGVGYGNPPGRLNDMASPSALTDGKTVFFYFGTGDLAAFDFDGKPIWSRNLQKDHGRFNMLYLYGSSPLLYRGKLYIQVIHRDRAVSGPASGKSDSYLLAVDPATGKDLWKQVRTTNAREESQESYGTPMPWDGPSRREIVVVGGDCATGHDAETGKELWRSGGWNTTRNPTLRIVPSALIAEDQAVICTPKNRGYVFSIHLGGDGDVSATRTTWRQKEIASDVCIPLYYKGNLYILDGDFKKSIYCVDPRTGQIKWSGRIDSRSPLRTSPTGADGKLYIMNEIGDVWVLAADEFRVLSKTSLGSEGTARASIAAARGAIFIRTGDKLYAFANK